MNYSGLFQVFVSIFVILFIVFLALVFLMKNLDRKRATQRSEWKPSKIVIDKFRKKYPGITVEEFELVLMTLKDFFGLIYGLRLAGVKGNVTMTSVIVDDLWHELILDTKKYMEICEYYNGYIHHNPENVEFKVDFSSDLVSAGVLKTYEMAKDKAESKDVVSEGNLPLLFSIDMLLGLRSGFVYNKSILDKQLNEMVKGGENL